MPSAQRHQFVLFADFSQFYIEDEQANPTPDEVGSVWTDETNASLLAPGRGFVRFGTLRATDVPVKVCVEESEPLVSLADYDHVAEASVDFSSGQLVIAGNSDYWPDAARIEIDAGTYRVRALYRGLDTLSSDGLEGSDVYTIVLWPAPASQAVVLKRYKAM